MRMIVLSSLFVLGIGLAAPSGAAAAIGSGLNYAAGANSPFKRIVLVCRKIEVCHHREFGRRVCRIERVCKERW